MAEINDPGKPTPWTTKQPIPSPQYPLSPRKEVTEEDLDKLRDKINNANYFEELAKLKSRIINMMLE